VVFTASAQNLLGVLCSSSIVGAISHKVLFFLSTIPFWGGVYGLENWCSRPKSWQKVSKREFLNFAPLSPQIARMASPCLSFLNLKTRSRTKPNVSPFSQERTPTHTESSRPPQQGHTTSHPQIAHELGQQGPYGAACMDAQSSHR
jgi:hypothetical protein